MQLLRDRGSGAEGRPWLHRESEVSLCYMRCSLKTNKSAKCDHCIWNIKAAGQRDDNVNQTQAAVTTQVRPDTTQNLSHEVLFFLMAFKPPPRFPASCCFRNLPDSCFHTFTLTMPHAGTHLLNGRVLALLGGSSFMLSGFLLHHIQTSWYITL